jgi:hypothetical protein
MGLGLVEQRVPEYLTDLIVSLRTYVEAKSQVANEQADTTAIVASLAVILAAGAAASANVNPNQTYVQPYVRHDGTPVRGHWRTDPNDTCLDNIRGCRSE